MSRLAVQFLDQGLHRALFDAMPLPVFVVDKDINVLEWNAAAGRLFDAKADNRKCAGDVLHCLHTLESSKGCGGASACSDCGLREAVQEAFQGRPVTRQQAEMELMRKGRPAKVDLHISCQPFTYERRPLAVLVFEGLTN